MRLGYVSNLRFSEYNDVRDVVMNLGVKCNYDILVVCGDLAERKLTIATLLRFSAVTPVVYVPGIFEMRGSLRDAEAWYNHLHKTANSGVNTVAVMNRSRITVNGITFTGAPLVTPPSKVRKGYKMRAPYGDKEWDSFWEESYKGDLKFLTDFVSPTDVVVTYSPPVMDVLPLNLLGTDYGRSYSPCIEEELKSMSPRAWFSNNAEPMNLTIGSTQLLSNPLELGKDISAGIKIVNIL